VKVGVIQSNYIPWRGYFDFIATVDLFIFHDDLQYTKGDWRNRNRIKTANNLKWLSVPVKYLKTSQLIEETTIDYSTAWQKAHINQFRAAYNKAPFVHDALSMLETAFEHRDTTISQLNIRIVKLLCSYLDINTELKMSSDYGLAGSKTARLIDLLQKTGATSYLSGPAAKAYLDENAFREAGIGLAYKSYSYDPYPQQWGAFEGAVTVLDLIANCGPESRNFLKSKTPDEVVIA
jgi:hypothetical protein